MQRLGDILKELGLIDDERLEAALRRKARLGGRIGEHLISLGAVTEDDLLRGLARQRRVPFADQTLFDNIDLRLRRLVPRAKANHYRLAPIRYLDGQLVLATCDGGNLDRMRELQDALGHRIRLVLCPRAPLETTLDRLYAADAALPRERAVPPQPAGLRDRRAHSVRDAWLDAQAQVSGADDEVTSRQLTVPIEVMPLSEREAKEALIARELQAELQPNSGVFQLTQVTIDKLQRRRDGASDPAITLRPVSDDLTDDAKTVLDTEVGKRIRAQLGLDAIVDDREDTAIEMIPPTAQEPPPRRRLPPRPQTQPLPAQDDEGDGDTLGFEPARELPRRRYPLPTPASEREPQDNDDGPTSHEMPIASQDELASESSLPMLEESEVLEISEAPQEDVDTEPPQVKLRQAGAPRAYDLGDDQATRPPMIELSEILADEPGASPSAWGLAEGPALADGPLDEPTAAPLPRQEIDPDPISLVAAPPQSLLSTGMLPSLDPYAELAETATNAPQASLTHPDLNAPGEGFGNYVLMRRVKTGGMAVVYEARTRSVEGIARTVAIKRILPHLTDSEEFVSMFIDEAKITVQLNHANIGQVYELGKVGDDYFICMEYINGRDLNAIFADAYQHDALIPVPLAMHIVQQMLEGLDYAHRKCDLAGKSLGIVHRDVSPANIICSFEGAVKMIDFGIAKAVSKVSFTRPGLIKGKISYMSPEQMRGSAVDHRSDVFSAGIILYELLSGRRLFLGDTDVETIRNVLRCEVPPLTRLRPDVPEDVAAIVHRVLTVKVDQRPQWASDLSQELQRAMITHDYRNGRGELVGYMAERFQGQPATEENTP